MADFHSSICSCCFLTYYSLLPAHYSLLTRISVSIRATPVCHIGRLNSKACCSFVVSRRELSGRLAGVEKALLGTALIASCATLSEIPARGGKSRTKPA